MGRKPKAKTKTKTKEKDQKHDIKQDIEKLVLLGKKKGFLTYDEVNNALSETVESSEEIDKIDRRCPQLFYLVRSSCDRWPEGSETRSVICSYYRNMIPISGTDTIAQSSDRKSPLAEISRR